MSGIFPIGTLVWAKMKGFSPWPGRVSVPPENTKKTPAKKGTVLYWIFFFGTKNYAWIEESNVKSYKENPDLLGPNPKASAALKEAIIEIKKWAEKKGEQDSDDVEMTFNLLAEESGSKSDPKTDAKSKEKPKTPKPKKETPSIAKKRTLSEKSDKAKDSDDGAPVAKAKSVPKKASLEPVAGPSFVPKKVVLKKTPMTRPRKLTLLPKKKKSSSESKSSTSSSSGNESPIDEAYLGETSSASSAGSPTPDSRRSYEHGLLHRPSATIVTSSCSDLDVENVTQTLRNKNIRPSLLKFGFLGIGKIGSGIVKNLLNSGHSVIIWNRTPDKCEKFSSAGAEVAFTPQDVAAAADIIFCSVSDPESVKELVFGNCGILSEDLDNKGYVELTGIDPKTSMKVAEAIHNRNGRYLEAQIQGSKEEAEEGTLVILAAGDKILFDQCQSCFEAMGKNSFFLGRVGNATKIYLVLQVMIGISMAGLAEAMALADRAGVSQEDFLEILGLTNLASPFLMEKGKAIIKGEFPSSMNLEHMQKDMKLAMELGDTLDQPLPISANTNEMFKHARRLGYATEDVSAVYIRARF